MLYYRQVLVTAVHVTYSVVEWFSLFIDILFNDYVRVLKTIVRNNSTAVERNLSGLIGTSSNPNTQKIRIIGFFFENMLHWHFEVRLLLFTVCTCV